MEKVRSKLRVRVETPFRISGDGVVVMERWMYLSNDKALKNKVLKEAHKSRFVVHPESTKINKDLKEFYWWPNIKKKIVNYVAKDDVLTSESWTPKAGRTITTTLGTWMEVRRYYLGFCIRVS